MTCEPRHGAGTDENAQMNKELELKNVKINSALSEETICFTATVYWRGSRVGTAKNRGHGGATDYDIELSALRDMKAWADEHYDSELKDMQGFDAVESMIDDEVTDHECWKQLSGMMRNKVVYLSAGAIYAQKIPAQFTQAAVIDGIKKHYPKCAVLNELPKDLALAYFKKFA